MKRPSMSALALRLFKESREREQKEFSLPFPKAPTLSQQDYLMGTDVADTLEQTWSLNVGAFLAPATEAQIVTPGSSLTGRSILEELSDGPLRPFVEGGPIGAYAFRPVPRPYTISNWPELERKAMLELKQKNDANLTRLEAAL